MRQNVTSTHAADAAVIKIDETDLTGIHVVLVDDSPDVRALLNLFLKRAGAKVDAFASAGDALIALREVNPDFIVSDIGMPEVDGYSFMQRYRILEREIGRAPVPSTALTAFTQPHHAEMALAAGFNRYLTKPIASEDLVRAVAKMAKREARPIGKTGLAV